MVQSQCWFVVFLCKLSNRAGGHSCSCVCAKVFLCLQTITLILDSPLLLSPPPPQPKALFGESGDPPEMCRMLPGEPRETLQSVAFLCMQGGSSAHQTETLIATQYVSLCISDENCYYFLFLYKGHFSSVRERRGPLRRWGKPIQYQGLARGCPV